MIASPIRPRSPDRNRASLPRASSPPPRNALRRFTFVRHHNAPTASFRPALTEARPRQTTTPTDRPVHSGPRPCSSMLGSPCQGPSTGLTPPISTSCPAHPPPPSGRRLRCDTSRHQDSNVRQDQPTPTTDARWGHFERPPRGHCKWRHSRAASTMPARSSSCSGSKRTPQRMLGVKSAALAGDSRRRRGGARHRRPLASHERPRAALGKVPGRGRAEPVLSWEASGMRSESRRELARGRFGGWS